MLTTFPQCNFALEFQEILSSMSMPLNNSNFLHAMQVCVHKAVGLTKIWRNLWLDVIDLYNIIIIEFK